MFCSRCGIQANERERFCRACGTAFDSPLIAPVEEQFPRRYTGKSLVSAPSKDPDELTGNGIGSVIVGDGFLIVAVFLSVTSTTISSLLWLLLLIPAFFFFGKGFADVLHARQIRRSLKQNEITTGRTAVAELDSSRGSVIDARTAHASGDLLSRSSVTDRTTRQLRE
ncbi:MAG: zinc ribbon domain-containing protein [Pyrinomonadaceae bacterium]